MHGKKEKAHQWALDKLGIEYTSLEQITHEDSLSSTVFRVGLLGGSCILKLPFNSTRFRREKHYLNLLQGLLPVPKVLYSIDPEPEFHGALVLETIPGAILKGEHLTDGEAFQLGAILARMHSIPVDSYGDLSVPQSQRKNLTPLELMKNYLNESLSECSHIVETTLLEKCRRFAKSHLSVLLEAKGPCIVHRDFRPGNALASEGIVHAIIDFEHAMGSFPEEDFAQMELLVWQRFPHSRESFLKGYKSKLPLPEYLEEIVPLVCFLKALGAIGFTWVRGTWQAKHSSVYKNNLNFIQRVLDKNGL